jgi:Ser/Thr protein kinase RdoA (MazF antagonist)
VASQCRFATFNDLLMAFGQQHPELARAIRSQKYAMLRELSTLGYGELPAVPGHFDFHHDNLLFQRGELTGLLDLDLTHLDARVADIASSIQLDCLAPPAYNEIDPAAAGAFVDGYTRHSALSDEELQLIVPLVRACVLSLVAWRLAHWAEGDRIDDALRSLERSASARFPSFARQRSELEAAVLQAGSR